MNARHLKPLCPPSRRPPNEVMKSAIVLQPRVRQDIQARTDKILRELGNPEPPLNLDDVRALLQLDRDYFTGDSDGLLQATVSKLKRGGLQILQRPMLLIDAVKKFDLRALYLPDRRRIMIDDSIPKPKHRWLEAHVIGHDLLPWHHDMLLGDDPYGQIIHPCNFNTVILAWF